MASALFGSTAIGYGDLFDRKVDDNICYKPVEFQGVTFLKRVSIMRQLIPIV